MFHCHVIGEEGPSWPLDSLKSFFVYCVGCMLMKLQLKHNYSKGLKKAYQALAMDRLFSYSFTRHLIM